MPQLWEEVSYKLIVQTAIWFLTELNIKNICLKYWKVKAENDASNVDEHF